MKYRLRATPDTVQWGFFDASVEPVLRVNSGDSVELDTVAGGPRHFEKKVQEEYYAALPQLREIHERLRGSKVGPHILTGPIEVVGAKVGQTLSVTFEHLSPAAPVGYNSIVPGKGTLPDEFPYARSRLIRFDRERRFALFPRGKKLPLRPFFGAQGVAPPTYMERVSSIAPGVHGGNMDNRELVAGTTLHLPIHVEGGNYSVGDGHALQGDGEVCVSALECAMHATVTLRVGDGMKLRWPMGETKTHMIAMGFSPDLDEAAQFATLHAVEYLTSTGLDRDDAYTLSSFMVDLHVTQLVNGVKGVHAMIPKSILGRKYRR